MPKKKPTYSGVLNKPMKPVISEERKRSIVPVSDDEYRDGLTSNLSDFFERLVALAKHYEIDINAKSAGWALAGALARDHVRGFQVEGTDARAANAPQKWTEVDRLTLWLSVRALRETGKTKDEALTEIFNNEAARKQLNSPSSVRALERQLRESGPKRCQMTALFDELLTAANASAGDIAIAYMPALSNILAPARKSKK